MLLDLENETTDEYRGKITEKSIRNFNRILKYMTDNGNRTADEISNYLGMSISGTRKILNRMLQEGLITVGGAKKNMLYGLITIQENCTYESMKRYIGSGNAAEEHEQIQTLLNDKNYYPKLME